MTIAQMLEPVAANAGSITLPHAQEWMQGRTMYGGMSALIAYTAAMRAFPDLPPLRAAQIGFVAPIGDTFALTATIVRQGRNVSQIRSEIVADGEVALTAYWLFGASRAPNAVHPAAPPENWPGGPLDQEVLALDKAPAFIRNNYEIRRAQTLSGPGEPIVRRWARVTDAGALDAMSQLILLGDTLPPGAMRVMQRRGPISSINWSFNLLGSAPHTMDGWWLTENASDHADDGYSSERLRLWNSEGQQVLAGMQLVAIFG